MAEAFVGRGKSLFEKLPPIEDTLKGKKVVVVGANQGIGFEAAKQLGERGAHVIITARSESKGQEAIKAMKENTPNAKYDLVLVDLMENSSIDKCIEDLNKFAPLDCIVLNAGVAGVDQSRETFDKIMKTNVYGTIYFAEKSPSVLKEGGRIVIVSAELANPAVLHKTYWDLANKPTSIHDPLFKEVPYIQVEGAWFLFYSASKAFEIKYAELASKDPVYTKKSIQISTNNPGWNTTNINNNAEGAPLKPPQGAQSIVWQVATSENVNGGFYGFGQRVDVNASIL